MISSSPKWTGSGAFVYLMRINYRTHFLLRQGPISGEIRRGHGPDVTTAFVFYIFRPFLLLRS